MVGKLQYKSFSPKSLPPNPPIELDEDTVKLLSKANRSIGILEGASRQIPNVELFVSMYVRKEALLSSQIEGTQATLDDILDPNIEENTNNNVADVINYIKASQYAKARLEDLPICSRLIEEIHGVLIEDVRGGEKSPGEFRRSQNWIGPQGSTLKNAKYIPPSPGKMKEAMSDLEQWIKFFLLGTYESAEDAIRTIEELVKLHDENYEIVKNTGRIATTMVAVFNYLEGSPIIDIQKISTDLGLSYNAVSNAVNKMVELGILKQTENVRRSRVFAYEDYLEILRRDT